MFDKDYLITGSHAEKLIRLTSEFDEKSKAKLFSRNVDVLINAPLIGFLYQRKCKKNNDHDKLTNKPIERKINFEQITNASEKLKYVLRLILLRDKENEPDSKKRLDLAFRNFDQEKNQKLFDEYTLGGIDILYEKLIENSNFSSDYMINLYDFLEDFNDLFNSEINKNDILNLCRKNE